MASHGLWQVGRTVEDLDRAADFYERVIGLRPIARFDPPGLAFFDLGGPRLLLEVGDQGDSGGVIYLRVDDIEAETERVRAAGATITAEPHLLYADEHGTFGPAGEEEWISFLADAEDNVIAFIERRVTPRSG